MPVPQEINFLVEQASCLFLTMVQFVRCNGLKEEGIMYEYPAVVS
ncbi:hypothetical protein [Microcoleus sp. D3_18a_C4]